MTHHRPGYPGSKPPGCVRLTVVTLLAAAALAACGGSGSPSVATSSLASNPAVVRAERVWKPTVDACAQHRHWVTHPVRSGEATVTCVTAKVPAAQRKRVEKCAAHAAARIPGTGYLAAVEAGLFTCLQHVRPVKS